MTTKADTSVKWFHSGMLDAPTLRGEAGALIELLDACLINGFSTRTPDSVVISDEVATVTLSGGNPYQKHAVIAITGASAAALNAEWRIDTSAATSFTFACPGVVSGAVTGATVKRASAGWGKPFSDANVGVYQSISPSSTQLYLRVNDGTTSARVRGFEQMSDANTGTAEFPRYADAADNAHLWFKSSNASSSAREWDLFSDGSMFFFLPRHHIAENSDLVWFGDINSVVNGDKYNGYIVAHNTTGIVSGFAFSNANYLHAGVIDYVWFARPTSQNGLPVKSGRAGVVGSKLGSDNTMYYYPDASGRTVFQGPIMAFDGGGSGSYISGRLRGYIPGLLQCAHYYENVTANHRGVFDANSLGSSRAVALMKIANGVCGFDIIGPWR